MWLIRVTNIFKTSVVFSVYSRFAIEHYTVLFRWLFRVILQIVYAILIINVTKIKMKPFFWLATKLLISSLKSYKINKQLRLNI